MKFAQHQLLKAHALAACEAAGAEYPSAKQIHPIVLAYIGDVVFSTYVRLRLLPNSSHVQVLHELGAKMVSAVYQCKAMQALEESLTEEELKAYKRGRNAKSSVPKSASVQEYRIATGFETLLGYMYLEGQEERLEEFLEQSFQIIRKDLAASQS